MYTYGQSLEPPQRRGLVWDYDKVGQCDSIQCSKPYQQGRQQCCLGECVGFFRPAGGKGPKAYTVMSSALYHVSCSFILSVCVGVCRKLKKKKLVLPGVEEWHHQFRSKSEKETEEKERERW